MTEVGGNASKRGDVSDSHCTGHDMASATCEAAPAGTPRDVTGSTSCDVGNTTCTTSSHTPKQRFRGTANGGAAAGPASVTFKTESRTRQSPEINRAPFGVSISRGLLPQSDSWKRLSTAAPQRVRKVTPSRRSSATPAVTPTPASADTSRAALDTSAVVAESLAGTPEKEVTETSVVLEAAADAALAVAPSSAEACEAGAQPRLRASPSRAVAGGSPGCAGHSGTSGKGSSSRTTTARCSPGQAKHPFAFSSHSARSAQSVATPSRARATAESESAVTPGRTTVSKRNSMLRDSSQPERRSGTPTAIRLADNCWMVESDAAAGDASFGGTENGGHRAARLKSRGAGRQGTPTKKQLPIWCDGGFGSMAVQAGASSKAVPASTATSTAAGCKPRTSPGTAFRELRSSPWQSSESTQDKASATQRMRQRRASQATTSQLQEANASKGSKRESEAAPQNEMVAQPDQPIQDIKTGLGEDTGANTSAPNDENSCPSKPRGQKSGPGVLHRGALNESRAALKPLNQQREKPGEDAPSSPLLKPQLKQKPASPVWSPMVSPRGNHPTTTAKSPTPGRNSMPGPTMNVRRQCRARGTSGVRKSAGEADGAAEKVSAAPRRLARSDTVPPHAFRTVRSPGTGCTPWFGNDVNPKDRSPGLEANSTPIRTPSRALRSTQAGGRSPSAASAATPRDLMQSLASPPEATGKKGGCRSSPSAGKSPAASASSPCPRGSASLDDAFGPWHSWDDATPVSANAETLTASELFETFRTSEDLKLILASFAQLFRQAVLAPNNARSWHPAATTCPPPWSPVRHQPWRFPYEPIRVLLGGHWKAKQLWQKLDARCSKPEYVAGPCAGGRLAGRRAVIIGAGPSGLRAAIELRLLGAQVTILERRERFTRLNRLHLWSWCGEELKALGARCLEPPPCDFGADPDLLHIGISELQILLLKTSLLLGVQVLLGCNYCGVTWMGADSGGWVVQVRHGVTAPSSIGTVGASAEKSPRVGGAAGEKSPTATLSDVAVLIGAGGLGCNVGRSSGLESIEVGNLRSEDAIGLVCNFAPTQTGERSLRSFALARQFYERLFVQLEKDTGAALENIVYTRSKVSHYFVMTPTRRCLAAAGVLRDPLARPMLASSNVDSVALDRLVRRIVAFRFKEGEATLPEAVAAAGGKDGGTLRYADKGPQLFDFSKMKRVAEGVTFMSPPTEEEGDEDLMVALAGDALVEPFWPEGLGIVRGFFGALDSAYAAARWACGAGNEVVRAEHAAAYGQLKSLAAASRSRVLRDDETSYGLVPSTRYRGVSSMEVHTDSP